MNWKNLIRPAYRWVHDVINQTATVNPFIPNSFEGRPVKHGHISIEHLEEPAKDDLLEKQLLEKGIKVVPYEINVAAYRAYLSQTAYPDSYYGGGKDPQQNFTEKTLEHFVSLDFLQLTEESVFIDTAACTSPFYQIVRKKYACTTYQQDLIFPKGLHADKIGGYASELILPDQSVDGITLHCSLEHFEGRSDTEFFQELERVLRPGGRAVILPFYLAHTYTIHVDPAFNLIKGHSPKLDPWAELRYSGWYQHFSRHYDPQALGRRILAKAPSLNLTIYRVQNFKEVDLSCYLRWIGVFEKMAS
ncbi:MAG: methyltransferase domain-containing protein [Bacteroidota bacterium]